MNDTQAPTLAERLAAAKAKQAAAEAELTLTDEERVADAELEAENAAALAAAKAKHGRIGVHIGVVEAPGGRIIIVKRPHPAAFKAFIDLEKATAEETEKFARPCVIYPSPGEFDKIADDCPGVNGSVAIRAAALAGARKTELSGK